MALEREILVLQHANSSGLRVLSNQYEHWSLVRYSNLEAAGLYLDSKESAIGIIDCSSSVQPDAEIEHWLTCYQGVSWVAILSKEQLSKKEWQLFVATYCYDYHTIPVSEEKLFITIGRAYGMSKLKNKLSLSFQKGEVIGRHESFQKALRQIYRCKSGPVTLSGEAGTGKHLLAERWAKLNGFEFIALDASSMELTNYLSNLDRVTSHGSTGDACLCINDVIDLSGSEQTHICNFLLMEVSGCEFVFCCGLSVDEIDESGSITSEFLTFLKKNWIDIPPLRDRGQDKVILAKYYLYKLSREQNKRVLGFSNDAENAIASYDWPGNVDELIERIMTGLFCYEGDYLNAESMGFDDKPLTDKYKNLSLRQAREEAEALVIKRALDLVSGKPGRAAELLCISRASLHRLIARYGIRR
jgi:DNA-binding NtrC family response regulator